MSRLAFDRNQQKSWKQRTKDRKIKQLKGYAYYERSHFWRDITKGEVPVKPNDRRY